MASAMLQPFDGSGIYGELTFVESDDGEVLTVFGTATGMRRAGHYVSLVHGLYSNADLDPLYSPPGPCMPDGVAPEDEAFLSGPQPTDLLFSATGVTPCLLGEWRGIMGMRRGASRMLRAAKPTTGSLGMHLYEMHTVSIRQSVRLRSTASQEPGQRLLSLSACGQIWRTP
ncbi:MAG: hypothetical protein ACRDS1_14960 [Pseudonocardiaceae bacterium]